MVAEPVNATIQSLGYLYNNASSFVSDQIRHLPAFDLNGLNPIADDSEYTPPGSVVDRLSRHKGIISALGIGLGGGCVYYGSKYYKSKKVKKPSSSRRRVPKLANGARQDVVLVVGSPTEPLTRLIALDFERRGFIVYLTILDVKDSKYTEANVITDDINYLNLIDSNTYEDQLNEFNRLLHLPVVPFPGADPHRLKLRAVVFTPSLYYPIGPFENITIASWAKVMDRLTIYPKLFSSGLIQLVRLQRAKTILISPNITSSLNLPYHGPESLLQNSLQSLFATLSKEIKHHGLSVTQIRLGNISVSSSNNSSTRTSNVIHSEIKGWNEDMRSLYSENFTKSQYRAIPIKPLFKGTHLRELHRITFDLIYSKSANPPVVYCGGGSRVYEWIASVFPASFLQWLLT